MGIRGGAILGLVIAVSLALILWLMRHQLVPLSEAGVFWLEVLTGNWSSDMMKSVAPRAFIIGTFLSVLLSLGTIVALINNVIRLSIIQRRSAMNVPNAFIIRETDIFDELIASVPEEQQAVMIPLIVEAFQKGREVWEHDTLPKLLGRDEASKFLNSLSEEKSYDRYQHAKAS